MQRIGDRSNDFRCSHAGRMKALDLFYGFNHPIYREVEYNDLANSVRAPKAIEALRRRNISFRYAK